MPHARLTTLLFLSLVLLTAPALAESGDEGLAGGEWRLELSTMAGFSSGSTKRAGDVLITGSAAYEWTAVPHLRLQLRAMPLFAYYEAADDDDDADTLFGAGAGLGARLFLRDSHEGWYAEAAITAVWHAGRFEGDSSGLDFLSEVGVGYQFRNDWHVTMKYGHLSNAGLGEDNAGVNAVGIGFGRSF